MILITAIIITGAIISIAVSLTDTKAFSDKPDEKQIKETDNEMLINYQQMYKQYDFAKYLNYYYTYTNKEYTENDDSNNGVENSEINPFAAATIDNKFNEKDDNTQKQQQHQQQQSNRGNEDDEKKYTLKSDRKDFADEKKFSSDKDNDNKKQFKNIKIIECRNLKINAYEVEDLKSIEDLINRPTSFENDIDGNQQGESLIENNRQAQEFNTGSNTKIIFICNNESYNLSPVNSNHVTNPIPSSGVIVPTNSQNNINNNNEDDEKST
ncbi:MAG: hypothetical protein MUO21_05430, partial [Nitrososphaeraceae archaeon]|nr:hypothetical protein [Nitrososphaeraceae archaeon]